jgi:hypothetical protein
MPPPECDHEFLTIATYNITDDLELKTLRENEQASWGLPQHAKQDTYSEAIIDLLMCAKCGYVHGDVVDVVFKTNSLE